MRTEEMPSFFSTWVGFFGGKSGGVGREVAFIDDYKEKPPNKPCSIISMIMLRPKSLGSNNTYNIS